MTTGIHTLDTSLSKTKQWIHELKDDLHLDNDDQGYVALRSVLHAVRDRLTVNEAAELGAQLPTIIRGVYYEMYHPEGKPLKIRSQQEFLDEVAKELNVRNDPKLRDPQRITLGVLRVLTTRISEGEIEDVRNSMPKSIQALWDRAQTQE
ncbi:MAG: DUF2267 domain-containing protein [Desulfohalobiaceae bacterium]|nr:DUF2267 domain-containing protein [Desulfohalobiaceae bacterium]